MSLNMQLELPTATVMYCREGMTSTRSHLHWNNNNNYPGLQHTGRWYQTWWTHSAPYHMKQHVINIIYLLARKSNLSYSPIYSKFQRYMYEVVKLLLLNKKPKTPFISFCIDANIHSFLKAPRKHNQRNSTILLGFATCKWNTFKPSELLSWGRGRGRVCRRSARCFRENRGPYGAE